ncbi:MAG: helix-turn-helix domain-containing protein [Chloroflexota bacterium]
MASALGLADEDGPTALTMRRLATRLGVEAASLYHHLPSKGALLQAMVDTVAARVVVADAADRPWPDQLRVIGTNLRGTLREHPGVVPIVATHPVSRDVGMRLLGPVVAAMSADVDVAEAARAVQSVAVFVIGHVLAEVGGPAEGEDALPARADDATFDAWFDAGLDALVRGFVERAGDRGLASEDLRSGRE